MAILRAHNVAIALGNREHPHHDIFGDGDRADAGAVGEDHLAPPERLQWHAIDAGVDRVQPFYGAGVGDRRRHVFLVVHVEPADLGARADRESLVAAGEPAWFQPVGQAPLQVRADEAGEGGNYAMRHWGT